MEQPEVFAELVRYALAEWTSEVVESVRTDEKFYGARAWVCRVRFHASAFLD